MKKMVVWSNISRLVSSALTKLGTSASGGDIVTDNWLNFWLEMNILGEPVSTISTGL